jgi:hypothetical protein
MAQGFFEGNHLAQLLIQRGWIFDAGDWKVAGRTITAIGFHMAIRT